MSASKKKWELGPVTFSTIGTAKNRMKEISNLGVDLIILDEAQEYPVNSEDSMISRLLDEIDFQGEVIGLTATPFITYRGVVKERGKSRDGTKYYMTFPSYLEVLTANNPLHKGESFWQDILYNTSPEDSFDKGFLVRPNYRLFRSSILNEASKKLKVAQGGQAYTEKSVKDFDIYMTNVYRAYAEKLRDRHKRSIVFVRTIEVAEELAKNIKGGYCISTNTKAKDRKEVLEKFKENSDEHMIIFNVSVLGRGFDSPNCEAVAFFTPTRSLIRYMQFVGRCLRPDPNNPEKEAFVYDFDLTDQKGDSRSTLKRFGKVENIYLSKNILGQWEIWSKEKGFPKRISGFQGDTTVWYEPKWDKWKKKKK